MNRYLLSILILFIPCIGYSADIVVEEDSPVVQGGTLSQDVGIEMWGGTFNPVIFMGCELPCQLSQKFSTADDDQREITIRVLRGVSKSVKDDVYLGTYKIAGIPPGPRGHAMVKVIFGASEGRLWLSASDVLGASEVQITRIE
jgi:molecular chaperone DnaK (HSP70)